MTRKPQYYDLIHIKRRDYMREYQRSHREESMRRVIDWQKKNGVWLAHGREANYIYALDIVNQEHKCIRCAENDLRCLSFDHINGGGWKDRSHKNTNIWIINHPEEAKKKYQVLCSNCNFRKMWENNEHFHK